MDNNQNCCNSNESYKPHTSHHSHGHSHGHSHDCHGEEKSGWFLIALSAIMLIIGMTAKPLGTDWISGNGILWYGIAYILAAYSVLKEAVTEAFHGDIFSEFALMSIASIGAFCIGEYPEAVAVMLLYRIGESLQHMAVDKARDNVRSLLEFSPDKAVVIINNEKIEKRPEDVVTGSIIEVKPGERVPLDGILTSKEASFNTAALTGESVPRLIGNGKEVLAGMIATDSIVSIKVTRPAKDSAISRILKMVEEASERKASTELFMRRFAHVYTPIVTILAAITVALPWIWSQIEPSYTYSLSGWLHRALVFLVISCPCALVISIPLGYFAGIGAASRRGILFKGGNSLDAVTELNAVVFDKTGTLTTGEFSVQDVNGLSAEQFAKVAAAERNSSHPIAKAVTKHADSANKGNVHFKVENLKDIPGYGLSADIDGCHWLIGTLRLLQKENVNYPKDLEDIPETIVVCAENSHFVGYILLADTIKEDAKQAVESLKANGMEKVEILSGDKQSLVSKVAKTLNVDNGYGNLLPQDKVAHIEYIKKQGMKVAFVGDGINDAPVLALSDVGIAMGAMGSDMAVETADIVIQTDQPSKVAEAVATGKLTRNIIKQNIVMAIGIKVAVMALGLLGIASLWMAVFADTGVALLAVVNAMRIRTKRIQPLVI